MKRMILYQFIHKRMQSKPIFMMLMTKVKMIIVRFKIDKIVKRMKSIKRSTVEGKEIAVIWFFAIKVVI